MLFVLFPPGFAGFPRVYNNNERWETYPFPRAINRQQTRPAPPHTLCSFFFPEKHHTSSLEEQTARESLIQRRTNKKETPTHTFCDSSILSNGRGPKPHAVQNPRWFDERHVSHWCDPPPSWTSLEVHSAGLEKFSLRCPKIWRTSHLELISGVGPRRRLSSFPPLLTPL